MEYTCWAFFLFSVICTFLPALVLSRPNLFDVHKPKATKFGIINWLNNFVPISSSHHPSDSNIRFGRSVNDQIYNDDESDLGYSEIKSTRTDKDNILCLYPTEDDSEHLICVSPRNITNNFYAISEPASEDDSEATAQPNHADIYLRSVRATNEDYRVRKSKATSNFLRFGKAMPFNRYDRGRDNFLRFGRSPQDTHKRKASADNFIRFGRALRERDIRKIKGTDYHIRLGRRNFDQNCKSGDCLSRSTRESNAFLRFCRRLSNDFDQPRQITNNALYDRDIDVNDVDSDWADNYIRSRYNHYPRFSKRSRNFIRLGRSVAEECVDDDENCVENDGRFKRSLPNEANKVKTYPNLSLLSKYKNSPKLISPSFKLRKIKSDSRRHEADEKHEDNPKLTADPSIHYPSLRDKNS